MSQDLLQTRLHLPPGRPRLVDRPRLVERLSEILIHPLTLLSAPPGFGKTTLLSEWIMQSNRLIGWLALDASDNDPVQFWSYLIAALGRTETAVGSSSLALLESGGANSIDKMLPVLINEMDTVGQDIVLVLDDYHVIDAPPIHQKLSFLLDHLPLTAHLVISGRSDPPLNLARLRARNQLLELHESDLRFTTTEAALFLNETMGLSLTPEQIEALERRTEGWIAGLQLAALSLRGREKSSDFVQAFTGSNRFVLDYLTDEVLNSLTEDVQTFLLQTSILERLSASLCNALTNRTDSQTILEDMERRNLFLIPLDEDRVWYRYHHLFADVLGHRLEQKLPGTSEGLHLRASKWFENEGLIPEAVGNALAARDWERAAGLMEQVEDSLRLRGQIATLRNWIDALPDSVCRAHPALDLEYARSLVETARFADAETVVAEVEQWLQTDSQAENPNLDWLRGKALALRAQIATTQGEFARAIELAGRAEQLLPPDDLSWRSLVALNLAGANRFTSNWAEADQFYRKAATLGESARDYAHALLALAYSGEVLEAQGQLHQAVQQFEQVLELAHTWRMNQAPVLGYALVGLARVLCEWNDLDAARSYAQSGLERGEQAGMMEISLRGYLALARIQQAENNVDAALASLNAADPVAEKMGIAKVKDWIGALRAQTCLAYGDTQAAVNWANHARGPIQDAVYPAVPRSLAHVWLALDEPDKALPLLEHALQSAHGVGREGNTVPLLAALAIVQHAQGNVEQALATLGQATALAEPEGYIRAFADEGEPMARLLRRLLTRTPASDYIRRLLDALGAPVGTTYPIAASLVEPLSEREVQVLRLIADGATNQEIANELVLTLNTVKKHVSNIFGKLHVSNRAQAIARARELKLL